MMNITANLNGYLLCPFQVVLDILEQLNIEKKTFCHLLFKPICQLEKVSHWVDLDSLGDPVALRAYELSVLLASALKSKGISALEISIFLGDFPLEIDNYYALLILARLIDGKLGVVFYIDDEKKGALEHYVSQSFINENLSIEISSTSLFVEKSQILHDLKNARYELLKQEGFDFFDPITGQITASGFEFHSSFIRYVWTGLKAGSYPISTRLLKHVLQQQKLSEKDNESLLMHLQHIHFLSHQHELVINQEYPSLFKYQLPEITINLYFIKAFSATLMKRFDIAEACFHRAGINLAMPITDENSLYQLNLLALYHLLKGDIDTAFMLERKLNAYLEENKIKNIAINYVVLINIARLYKKARKLEQAFIFYEKAYEQIREGGFTNFDSMYYNMDKAGIYESLEDYYKALTSWIKVALYWLASPNPYSLALKPRVVLCQEQVSETLAPLCRKKVNHFLLKKIKSLSDKMGYTFEYCIGNKRTLISSNITHQKNTVYLADDILIYGCKVEHDGNRQPSSDVEEELSYLITFLLQEHLKIDIEEDAIIIESHYENIKATSWHNHFAIAALQGCSHYSWNGSCYDRNNDQVRNILTHAQLKLSRMIQSNTIDSNGISFIYKRNFLNKFVFSRNELEIINQLFKSSKGLLTLGACDASSIISLLLNNVIELECDNGNIFQPY